MVPNFFHLRMMEATVLIGTFKVADIFLYPSPDLCLETILFRRSTDNSFDFMLGLCSDTVNCGTLYIQVCAFPNQVQSTEFTTGGLQLSSRSISRMIRGNKMNLSSILSFMAKAVNTYVNVISSFFIYLQESQQQQKSCCHYGVLCVEL